MSPRPSLTAPNWNGLLCPRPVSGECRPFVEQPEVPSCAFGVKLLWNEGQLLARASILGFARVLSPRPGPDPGLARCHHPHKEALAPRGVPMGVLPPAVWHCPLLTSSCLLRLRAQSGPRLFPT